MSDSPISPRERAARYVGALRAVRQDRGRLAALRRGLSPATITEAWPVIAALGGDLANPIFVAIGGLFATHPEESANQNLGAVCREIGLGSDGKLVDGVERRFRRLLSSRDTTDVIAQLRSWVRLAASKGVGIGYEGLFADLWNWRWYSDEIRVKWARAFWQAVEPVTEPTFQTPTAE